MKNEDKFQIEADINKISSYLARRDIEQLTTEQLSKGFGIKQADMLIILGNSMPCIAELGARAYKAGLSKELMIVGGVGHSTRYLVENVLKSSRYKDIEVKNRAEADILKDIIVKYQGLKEEEIIIENKSANCGANAHEALKVLEERRNIPRSIILLQDPTMQQRTHASFLKEWEKVKPIIISYSPFIPELKFTEEQLEFVNTDIQGIWAIDRFIDLIMGEIPRLRDDEKGYGPKGKGFINHVEVPEEVIASYKRLLSHYSEYSELKNRK